MKVLNTLFATDHDKEVNGVKVTFGDALTFYIARSGGSNKEYGRVLEEKTRPYRRMIVNEVMPNDMAANLMKEVYAETIVKGLHGDDGHELTPGEIIEEFNDPNYGEEFYQFVREEAARAANFKQAEREDALKN